MPAPLYRASARGPDFESAAPAARRLSCPHDAGNDARMIAFHFHPRSGSIPQLASRKLSIDHIFIQRQPGWQSF
jgi:hypothetical protein